MDTFLEITTIYMNQPTMEFPCEIDFEMLGSKSCSILKSNLKIT